MGASIQPEADLAPVALTASTREVARLLASRAPFDALAAEELATIAAATEIEFHPAGARIIDASGAAVSFLRVIYSGAV
ncbi:MAG TPA: hypothetical protein VKU35_05840, partial [Candidatus Limnocylindria bacterium]|nr:hypothetical protein [Candidatus Limnocylindria bacterium]